MTLRYSLFATLIGLVPPGTAVHAQAGPASWDRAAITARIADLQKISTPEGIEAAPPSGSRSGDRTAPIPSS
jgi:hypothetical protein